MSDPHDRFSAWLAEGAIGQPPRDLALHASSCAECLSMAGALDDLATVDLDGAELPPMLAGRAPRPSSLASAARWSAGAAVLVAAALVVAILGSGWPSERDSGAGRAAVERTTQDEGVLGGTGGSSSTDEAATPHATVTPAATASQTDDPDPTSVVEPEPVAPVPGQPPPSSAPMPPAPFPPAGTPRPSAPPTPTPSAATPPATPTPTPVPPPPSPTPTPTPPTQAPSPTPTPTPTPSPEAPAGGGSAGMDEGCTDGIDDDGDLLIDLLDPGCQLGGAERDL